MTRTPAKLVTMSNSVKIAFLGLGEDSCLLAAGLAATGAQVLGYDSGKVKRPPVQLAESIEAAVADADVVLSLNSSLIAIRTAEAAARAMKPGAIYVDLNTGNPEMKMKLAALFPAATFVDAAPMKPIGEHAEKTPLIVSGEGANALQSILVPLGMNLDVVSENAGDAAARRLLFSLFTEGLTATIADTLWAAKSMGLENWAFDAIRSALESANASTVQSYIDETGKFPKRHSVAMADIAETLASSGYESTMVNGIGLTFSHIMHGRKIPFADLTED
jgi:putative dehydrogenase